MTVLALVLVLSSAVVHASWNLLAKRASGGAAFIWLFAAMSSLLYAPVAAGVVIIQRPHLSPWVWGIMAGSGALHVAYFILLQRGYRSGDLSLVYPLARGTGPVLSTLTAIALLHEHPSPIALAGVVLMAIGAVLITRTAQTSTAQTKTAQSTIVQSNETQSYRANERGADRAHPQRAIAYGLLTGAVIAAYTLWDKQGVSLFLVPPLLMDYGSNLSRVALLTPFALRHWPDVQREWQMHRRQVIGVACLSPLAYILVLTALATTPVSYVAPLREISILIGVMFGTHFLSEGNTTQRLLSAGVMVVGAIALAVG